MKSGHLLDTPIGRDQRERGSSQPVPPSLDLIGPEDRALLGEWVVVDNPSRRWDSLLKIAGSARIERANALCDRLLSEGWLARRERRVAGLWRWESVRWRDLETLKRLLGVSSATQRDTVRQSLLAAGRQWLEARRFDAHGRALDPDLLDELEQALSQLEADKAGRIEILASRLDLLRSLCNWHDAGEQGNRRDFAMKAKGTTKSLSSTEWKWLGKSFDLERLGIQEFAPEMALAGDISLHRGPRRMDLGMARFVDLPLADVGALDAVTAQPGALRGYWLIENRASFERQAPLCEAGWFLLWLPGRPSKLWLKVMAHLLTIAPAPCRISGDADPAGVDIACSVGRLWRDKGLEWMPYRMGVEDWEATRQRWPLNAHDRALLERLTQSAELPSGLRALCEAMVKDGRKAEQEAWL